MVAPPFSAVRSLAGLAYTGLPATSERSHAEPDDPESRPRLRGARDGRGPVETRSRRYARSHPQGLAGAPGAGVSGAEARPGIAGRVHAQFRRAGRLRD